MKHVDDGGITAGVTVREAQGANWIVIHDL